MRIWAIGDLHLSFGVENKSMDVFGPAWEAHAAKIASSWKSLIDPRISCWFREISPGR